MIRRSKILLSVFLLTLFLIILQGFLGTFKGEGTEREKKLEISFYAEFLPAQELLKKEVMELLDKYQIHLYIAISEEKMAALTPVLKEYQRRNIEYSLWPVMSKEDGYWVQERNLKKFSQFLDRIFEWAKENKIEIREVLIDFEPKQFFELVDVENFGDFLFWARKTARENIGKSKFEQSKQVVRQEIIEKIRSRGIKVTATFSNFGLEEIKGFSTAAQDFLEAPVFGLPWDRIDFQCYNFPILARSSFTHPDLARVLYSLTERARKYCHTEISFSVGLLSPQEFSSEEVIVDIGAVLAAGVYRVNIYSLDGLLEFTEPEKEIERILQARPEKPPLTIGATWLIFLRKMGWFYLRSLQFLKNL